MDLSKVVLINFVDKRRLGDDDPNVTVQRLVRFSDEQMDEFNESSQGGSDGQTPKEKQVLSLTRRHWDIFDSLVDDYNVKTYTLIDAVKRYQQIKPCGFDQAMEVCLEMIWQSLGLDNAANDGLSADEGVTISEADVKPSGTVH